MYFDISVVFCLLCLLDLFANATFLKAGDSLFRVDSDSTVTCESLRPPLKFLLFRIKSFLQLV